MLTCENVRSETGRSVNSYRPLAHLLEPPERQDAVKATRTCSIDGCDRRHRGRGLCSMHLQRLQRLGEVGPVGVLPSNGGSLPLESHPNWAGSTITYHGAHIRTRKQRGSASSYTCQHCDSNAAHWAYDHADPAELRHDDGRPYSADPGRYIPLCVPCHHRFDAASRVVP